MPIECDPVLLKKHEQRDLNDIARSQSLPAGFLLRAKIVLLLADGLSYAVVAYKLDTSTRTVGKWKRRFLQARLDGFETKRPAPRPPIWLASSTDTSTRTPKTPNPSAGNTPTLHNAFVMCNSSPRQSIRGVAFSNPRMSLKWAKAEKVSLLGEDLLSKG